MTAKVHSIVGTSFTVGEEHEAYQATTVSRLAPMPARRHRARRRLCTPASASAASARSRPWLAQARRVVDGDDAAETRAAAAGSAARLDLAVEEVGVAGVQHPAGVAVATRDAVVAARVAVQRHEQDLAAVGRRARARGRSRASARRRRDGAPARTVRPLLRRDSGCARWPSDAPSPPRARSR